MACRARGNWVMSKTASRKTNKKDRVGALKLGSRIRNRDRRQGLSREAKNLAIVSTHLPARDRKVLLAMARILAGRLVISAAH